MISFPEPAETWAEATDAQGRIKDSTLPRQLVRTEADFDRWQLCLIAASQLTGQEWSPEVRYLATVLFSMPVQFTWEEPKGGETDNG